MAVCSVCEIFGIYVILEVIPKVKKIWGWIKNKVLFMNKNWMDTERGYYRSILDTLWAEDMQFMTSMTFRRVLQLIQAWVTVLLAVSTMSIHQQHVVNKVSFNKNTLKGRVYSCSSDSILVKKHFSLISFLPEILFKCPATWSWIKRTQRHIKEKRNKKCNSNKKVYSISSECSTY